MENKKVLSIVIPTYNRACLLERLLCNLFPQIKEVGSDKIQIVISDNASTDNTADIVSKLSSEYDIAVEFYKQPEHIGLDNLDFVAGKAVGKYSLMSGDDDIYAPFFLKTIMPYLEESTTQYTLIHWNRLVGNEECSNTRIYHKDFEECVKNYSTVYEFLEASLSSTNFVSSLIYNTKCWEYGISTEGSQKWEGYRYWGKILHGAVRNNAQCLYFYFPLVIQRITSSHTWQSKWPYFAIFEISDIFSSIDTFIPGIQRKWMERLHDTDYYNITGMIDNVVFDIDFYRGHQSEMELYLTPSEQKRLRMWLEAKNPIKKQQCFYKIQRIKRILKNVLK